MGHVHSGIKGYFLNNYVPLFFWQKNPEKYENSILRRKVEI
jgi:hypothetical protein